MSKTTTIKADLTQRQHDFVINYIKNGFQDAYNAARKAGYSHHVAKTGTKALINQPQIQEKLLKAYQRIDNDILNKFKVTIEDRIKLLSRIIYDIMPDTKDSEPQRKLYGEAIKALQELNKMQGDYAPDKRLSVTVDATKEKLEQVKRQYEEY